LLEFPRTAVAGVAGIGENLRGDLPASRFDWACAGHRHPDGGDHHPRLTDPTPALAAARASDWRYVCFEFLAKEDGSYPRPPSLYARGAQLDCVAVTGLF
jgi:hypothetical protein